MPSIIPSSSWLAAVAASGIVVIISPSSNLKTIFLALFKMANANDKTTKSRASVRYSTYSMSPSLHTTDSAIAEISDIEKSLHRMVDPKLERQRVVLNDHDKERFGKLALGAKLERALDRRMSSQDAVMRKRTTSSVSQKSMTEKEAAA
jgi:hypothetical protein